MCCMPLSSWWSAGNVQSSPASSILPQAFVVTAVCHCLSIDFLPFVTHSVSKWSFTFFLNGCRWIKVRHPHHSNIISCQLSLKNPHLQVRAHHEELSIMISRTGFWSDTIQVMEKPIPEVFWKVKVCLERECSPIVGGFHGSTWHSRDLMISVRWL